MHLTAAEKVFWVISVVAILTAGLAGLRVRLENENDPCYGGQYGTNYEECIGCIQNESYCASVFGAPGAEMPTPTPTATAIPDVYCNNYANDYETCLACINQAYCDQIFRGRTPTATPSRGTSTPTPTAKPKSTAKPTPTPQSSAAGQAPTPTPTPTPTLDCNNYANDYQTCLACINQAYCDQIFN